MKITKQLLQEMVEEELKILVESDGQVDEALGDMFSKMKSKLTGGSTAASAFATRPVQMAVEKLKTALEKTSPQNRAMVVADMLLDLGIGADEIQRVMSQIRAQEKERSEMVPGTDPTKRTATDVPEPGLPSREAPRRPPSRASARSRARRQGGGVRIPALGMQEGKKRRSKK